jgi:uncharacterized protein with von Willebrand factor type A (vWA) domain
MTVSQDEMKQVSERFKRSRTLQKIMDLAGANFAYRLGVKRKQEQGMDQISGVTQVGDLTRLLPSESMMLAAGPPLSTNMLRRLVENQTLALHKTKMTPVGRGPIVVVIDGSGSMSNGRGIQPIHQAKALALTMARVAKQQRRWIALVEFGNDDEWKELVMAPDAWNLPNLLDWLEHFFSGGTDFGVLNRVAESWPRWKCPKGQTDIIFVTDTNATLGEWIVKPFNQFKAEQNVRCYGLAINSHTGDLPLVCDRAWTTQSMGLESQPVKQLLASA